MSEWDIAILSKILTFLEFGYGVSFVYLIKGTNRGLISSSIIGTIHNPCIDAYLMSEEDSRVKHVRVIYQMAQRQAVL